MNALSAGKTALPRLGQSSLRSFSSSPSSSMPRAVKTKTYGLLADQKPKLRSLKGSKTAAAAQEGAETAPTAWFIPKASGTAPVARPSFLPTPPRTEPTSEDDVPPLPKRLPASLHPLWTFIHTHPLLVRERVHFIDTRRPAPRTIPILVHPPRNGRRNRGFVDSGAGIGGMKIGGWWEWQVVCVVQGMGPGDIRRAEAGIREWLALNPLKYKGHVSDVRVKVPRPVKGTPPSEWAQIDTGVGVSINVMTAREEERADLRGIWADPV